MSLGNSDPEVAEVTMGSTPLTVGGLSTVAVLAIAGTACMAMFCATAVGLVIYLGGIPGVSSPSEVTRPGTRTIITAFPGDDQDRRIWVGLLAQFGEAVKRDAEQPIPTLRTLDHLKARWRECQRVRMDHRGQGTVWGPDYDTFGGLLEATIDRAVGNEKLTVESCNSARDAFVDAAQQLAGADWQAIEGGDLDQ